MLADAVGLGNDPGDIIEVPSLLVLLFAGVDEFFAGFGGTSSATGWKILRDRGGLLRSGPCLACFLDVFEVVGEAVRLDRVRGD